MRLSFYAQIARGVDAAQSATGWRRRLTAFFAGILAALAQAPYYALPFAVVGFSILIVLLDAAAAGRRPLRAAAATGWFFGFGYFLVGLYWLALAFFVQAAEFAWMAPFALFGMPAFLALFPAVACALAAARWRAGPRRIFWFAAVYMAIEYARGHILTGLPWNLPGQIAAVSATSAQPAAWIGVYGLSLMVVLIAASPAATIARGSISLRGAAAGFCALLAIMLASAVRLSSLSDANHDAYRVRIIQPAIGQREKVDPAYWSQNFRRHLDLSASVDENEKRVFVVWPENSAPLLGESQAAIEAVDAALPASATLIAGAVRRSRSIDGTVRYHNSVLTLGKAPTGRRVAAVYDKHHLVPFGEYLPFADVLRAVGLAQLAPFDEGFSPGPGPQTLVVDGLRVAPLICYETIFPGNLYPREDRPDWLVTVTNDAWFGDSAGPRQHLDQARLRAIETGLPMARAANTGVSALIDGRGVYRARINLYDQSVIDAPLPRPLAPTLYEKIGDLGFAIVLIFSAALGSRRQ